MERKNHHGIRFKAILRMGWAYLAVCTASWGQVAQQLETTPRTHGQFPQTAQTYGTSHANQPVAAPTSAPSLLDKPPKPATVNLAGGHLTIQADNSSLMDILGQVTAASGMAVEGLGVDQRIFGSYGPGEPHEVLSALLHGSGYNMVMLGQTAAGAPRQLTLSPRGAGVSIMGRADRHRQTRTMKRMRSRRSRCLSRLLRQRTHSRDLQHKMACELHSRCCRNYSRCGNSNNSNNRQQPQPQ